MMIRQFFLKLQLKMSGMFFFETHCSLLHNVKTKTRSSLLTENVQRSELGIWASGRRSTTSLLGLREVLISQVSK